MNMYLPEPKGGDFKPVPDGTHSAICTRVIDLGTQHSVVHGVEKIAHKIMLTWEIPAELMDDGRPFTISQRYTWSMHEKAILRQHLESWRGLAFSERDFGPNGFNIKNVLGKSCTLNVKHEPKNGTTYANVAGIGKPMKGAAIPAHPTNELIYLWLHPTIWSQATYDKLSDSIKTTIAKSPEYADLIEAKSYAEKAVPADLTDDEMNDVIPF